MKMAIVIILLLLLILLLIIMWNNIMCNDINIINNINVCY